MVTTLDFDNRSEFMNYDLVRRYGFYYRYDTPTELRVLNQLWPLVNDRLNFTRPH